MKSVEHKGTFTATTTITTINTIGGYLLRLSSNKIKSSRPGPGTEEKGPEGIEGIDQEQEQKEQKEQKKRTFLILHIIDGRYPIK